MATAIENMTALSAACDKATQAQLVYALWDDYLVLFEGMVTALKTNGGTFNSILAAEVKGLTTGSGLLTKAPTSWDVSTLQGKITDLSRFSSALDGWLRETQAILRAHSNWFKSQGQELPQ